jgi:hypothetical protein
MKKVYDKAVALQQENDLNQTMITFTQKGVQV